MISTTSAPRGAADDLFDDWLGVVPDPVPELEPVPVDLVPLQRWYLEGETGDPGLWTASLFLAAGERLDSERLRRALAAVVAHHPALRLRPFRDGAGRWTAQVAPEVEAPFQVVDLAGVPSRDRPAVVAEVVAGARRGLDLDRGRLVAAVLFDEPDASRVLFVIHHLAVDEYSWQVFVEHVEAAYVDVIAYEAARDEAEDGEYARWAAANVERARSRAGRAAAGFWLRQPPPPPLPVDLPGGQNLESLAAGYVTALTAAETALLQSGLRRGASFDLQSALATAIHRAMSAWTGERRMGLWIVNHGRSSAIGSARTPGLIGCLIHSYPVTLDAPAGCGDVLDLAAELHRQVAAVPDLGLDFGICRYLGDDELRGRMAALPLPDVILNFGGSFDCELAGPLFRRADPDLSIQGRDPRGRRGLPFDVDCQIVDGELAACWKYGTALHRTETVAALAGRFRDTLLEIAGRLAG